jgi:hypothetical protein
VGLIGTSELHAAFFKESRTRYDRWGRVQEDPGPVVPSACDPTI